ncbi:MULTISPECIES: hypothetical protein [Calothrix]|uniref:Uncharacterized protein n=2 Tax=Calothrix TaxID=1186 RepID=A0ABR8A3P8_9CYAN|nr:MULTISPECIES: hypothetical protein [Calothrix]MBD2194010.1 hypothetical protein [Calothrix parietina FACHB-288]MBD2223017.1 hypothetical protein [Calothrix anomala FACHB-343]
MLRRNFVTLPVVLAVLGSTFPATALPSEVFTAQLPEIQENIPAGYGMRLPEHIRLGDGSERDLLSKLTVRVFPSPRGLIVGLFNCEAATTPCLVGTFSTDNPNSVSALYEFAKHKAKGDEISLAKNIQGYFLDGNEQNPKLPFSSLMWKQDGIIHTVSFPAKERQNILFMGYSMANQPAIRRNIAKVKRPNSVFSLVK